MLVEDHWQASALPVFSSKLGDVPQSTSRAIGIVWGQGAGKHGQKGRQAVNIRTNIPS